jgi:hypothetical protein
MKFNIVVANPSFSLDKWGAETADKDPYCRFWRGTPPKSKTDYAFIGNMIEIALEGEGKVGVIVPHGVLFRGGAEGKIRQRLIGEPAGRSHRAARQPVLRNRPPGGDPDFRQREGHHGHPVC